MSFIIEQNELARILPQAYPFLMIDRVVEFEKDKKLVAIKNITADEWVFDDKYFEVENYPETLLIEAAAQTSLLLYHMTKIQDTKRQVRYYLGRVEYNCEKRVVVGDQLKLTAFANKLMNTGGYSQITISVNETSVGNVQVFYSVEDLINE